MNAACTWSFDSFLIFWFVSVLSMRRVTILAQHLFQWQEEKDGEAPRVLQHYTAEKLSCFGELALMLVTQSYFLPSCGSSAKLK